VNTPLTLEPQSANFADMWMTPPSNLSYLNGIVEKMVWCGAHRTAKTDACWHYLFQRRSHCALASRALVSRRFRPTTTTLGQNLPRDLREMLARALWESRVEDVWDQ